MSDKLFDSGESSPDSSTTGTTGEEQSYLDLLVGDGKKYADVETLAKSYVNADSHIQNLEREKEELRKDLNSRLNMQKFLDKLESVGVGSSENTNSENVAPPKGESSQQTSLTMEQIEQLVTSKMKEATTQQQREMNVDNTVRTLREKLGPSYGDIVTKVTEEIGASREFMIELAANNPQAFLKLVTAEGGAPSKATPEQASRNFSAPHNTVASVPGANQGTRNQAYYDKMRKEDPSRYWLPSTQNEMHREAMKLGEAFFTKQ